MVIRSVGGGPLHSTPPGSRSIVIDRSAYEKQLRPRLSRAEGARVMTSARGGRGPRPGGDAVKVRAGSAEYECSYYVDATGPSGVLRRNRQGLIPAAKYEVRGRLVRGRRGRGPPRPEEVSGVLRLGDTAGRRHGEGGCGGTRDQQLQDARLLPRGQELRDTDEGRGSDLRRRSRGGVRLGADDTRRRVGGTGQADDGGGILASVAGGTIAAQMGR